MGTIPVGTEGVNIRLRSIQNNEFCFVNLFYFCGDETVSLDNAVDDVIAAWWTQVSAALLPVIAQAHTFVDVFGKQAGVAFPYESTQVLSVTGTAAAGNAMPVWDTWSLDKLPDNENGIGTVVAPFKRGRISFSGVPEAMVNNGLVESAWLDELATLCTALLSFSATVGGNSEQFFMRMMDAPTNPTRQAHVTTVQFNRVGTQLTRKS
jgi:hypothetical protein